ncbi:MAG: hypothetical protein JRG81_00130 [Deltaproteobacteria bacterium]|nr:hypothetical protein [Deltaproteobacteria bacterium]MBW2363484.1 hypothetical protein [Deltaproteobacteria bacterium]
MDAIEIERLIRRDIREIGAVRVGSDDFTRVIADAVNLLGLKLVGANPTYFNVRKSLSSLTNIFILPSSIYEFSDVKDMGDNALVVSGAVDDGSGGIKITLNSVHPWETGHIVTHHDIGGTVEANDTFAITVIDTLNYTLDGSVFENTYTSGGKAFRETANFSKIVRKPLGESSNYDFDTYYTRVRNLVIDDVTFENDIIIEYITLPIAITDIPDRFHYGIVSYGVIGLIKLPKFGTQHYPDKYLVNKNHKALWANCIESAGDFRSSAESNNLSDVKRIKTRI